MPNPDLFSVPRFSHSQLTQILSARFDSEVELTLHDRFEDLFYLGSKRKIIEKMFEALAKKPSGRATGVAVARADALVKIERFCVLMSMAKEGCRRRFGIALDSPKERAGGVCADWNISFRIDDVEIAFAEIGSLEGRDDPIYRATHMCEQILRLSQMTDVGYADRAFEAIAAIVKAGLEKYVDTTPLNTAFKGYLGGIFGAILSDWRLCAAAADAHQRLFSPVVGGEQNRSSTFQKDLLANAPPGTSFVMCNDKGFDFKGLHFSELQALAISLRGTSIDVLLKAGVSLRGIDDIALIDAGVEISSVSSLLPSKTAALHRVVALGVAQYLCTGAKARLLEADGPNGAYFIGQFGDCEALMQEALSAARTVSQDGSGSRDALQDADLKHARAWSRLGQLTACMQENCSDCTELLERSKVLRVVLDRCPANYTLMMPGESTSGIARWLGPGDSRSMQGASKQTRAIFRPLQSVAQRWDQSLFSSNLHDALTSENADYRNVRSFTAEVLESGMTDEEKVKLLTGRNARGETPCQAAIRVRSRPIAQDALGNKRIKEVSAGLEAFVHTIGGSRLPVILPLLTRDRSRDYAAAMSLCFGVIPPRPMLGRS